MELKARNRVRLVFSFYDDQVLSCVHRQSFHLRMRAIDLRVVHPHFTLAHDSLNGIIHALWRIFVLFQQPFDQAPHPLRKQPTHMLMVFCFRFHSSMLQKSSSGQRALSVISLKGTFGKPRHTKIPIALLPNPLLAF